MAYSTDQIRDTLKRAMRGEQDGYRFYDLLSKRITNPDARRRLVQLRDDEIRHLKVLKDIYSRMVGGEVGELPDQGISALTEIFNKGQVNDLKTEMEFLSLAIEAELAATDYYRQISRNVDDPDFRKVCEQLADEEHRHFEILQAEKDALAGNYSWFGLDEGSPMEH